MKINELRSQIESYSSKDLQVIIAEMYKAIPKKIKEEKQLDNLIRDPHFFKDQQKQKSKHSKIPDMGELKDDINTFIANANNHYYFAPNQVIPKKERSKWRFKVKRYYKDLIAAYQLPENRQDATECMENLYQLLCRATGVYLFVSAEPFEAIGVSQDQFLEQTLRMKQEIEQPQTWVKNGLRLALENENDRDFLKIDLVEVLIHLLKTAPLTEFAIEEAKKMKRQVKKNKPTSKKIGFSSDWFDYQRKSNELVETVFLLYIKLHEWGEAIVYFKEHYQEDQEEIKLYVLLEWIFKYNSLENWRREYETATDSGIKPRKGLQRMYQYINDHGEFPQYMDYTF